MRRSVIGPLFIILLGSVLLAQNLASDFSAWGLFAEQWPWLLVGWGALRLIEHGAAALRGGEGPPPMRAGALALALLLCAFGSAAHGIQDSTWPNEVKSLFGGFALVNPPHRVEVSKSWPAEGIRTLEIDGYLGEVTLSGDDQDSIRLEGRRDIVADSLEEAREASATAPVRFEIEGDTARLDPSGSPQRRFSGNVVIRAPRTLALAVRDGDGDLKVQDFDAGAAIQAGGGVEVERMTGDVAIEIQRGRRAKARDVMGDFSVSGSPRRVEARRIQGSVSLEGDRIRNLEIREVGSLRLASRALQLSASGGVSGSVEVRDHEIDIRGVEGGLELDGQGRWEIQAADFGAPTRLQAQRGEIQAKVDADRLGDLELRLESGNIRLSLPADAQYALEASGSTIESSLPEHRAATDASLSVGGASGDPQLRLHTGRGKIELVPLELDR